MGPPWISHCHRDLFMVNDRSDRRTVLLFADDTTLLSRVDCLEHAREVAEYFEKAKI